VQVIEGGLDRTLVRFCHLAIGAIHREVVALVQVAQVELLREAQCRHVKAFLRNVLHGLAPQLGKNAVDLGHRIG